MINEFKENLFFYQIANTFLHSSLDYCKREIIHIQIGI